MTSTLILIGVVLTVFGAGFVAEAIWAELARVDGVTADSATRAYGFLSAGIGAWALAVLTIGDHVGAAILTAAAAYLAHKAWRATRGGAE